MMDKHGAPITTENSAENNAATTDNPVENKNSNALTALFIESSGEASTIITSNDSLLGNSKFPKVISDSSSSSPDGVSSISENNCSSSQNNFISCNHNKNSLNSRAVGDHNAQTTTKCYGFPTTSNSIESQSQLFDSQYSKEKDPMIFEHLEESSSSSPNLNTSTSKDLRRQLCDQNLFVFHLPPHWTEKDLRREFETFGSILSAKVAKRSDGTSKGYGFVCFTESLSACQAVEAMHGKSYSGKRLKVSLKKTPEECLHSQVQKLIELSNPNQTFDRERDCTLFVFHLPSSWDDKEMYKNFRPFGVLRNTTIAKRPDGSSRGYGFIMYDNPRAAALAIANMNGLDVGDKKRLKVQLKQNVSQQQLVPGCTIFIFHLPSDWTEIHLRQHFNHYGKILGATVQRDARENSRGFGFISFERQQSAVNAVIGMNGFLAGRKRLKVSLKKREINELDSIYQAYLGYDVNKELSCWDPLANRNNTYAAVDFGQSSPLSPASIGTTLQTSTLLPPAYAADSASYGANRLGTMSHVANYPATITSYSYANGYPNHFQSCMSLNQNYHRFQQL